ncbi:sre G protein-coupled chemoreceptor domain-containing protein [Ditylenchus destructor]|nr:sre G protein-coupled chemoreceptor domain-containing protein [Ditylenchus destructor]
MSTAEPPLVPFNRITVGIYSLNNSTGFSALLILESSLILSAVVVIILALFLLKRTQFVHINCHRIMANIIWHYLVFGVAPRYLEIVYTFYYTANWNSSLPMDVRIQSPVFWTGICRIYFVFVGGFTLFASAIERSFAIVFIYDYEKNCRSWISALLMLIIDIAAILFTFVNVFDLAPIAIQVCVVGAVNIVALSMMRKIFVAAWICSCLVLCSFVAALLSTNSVLSHYNFELFDLVIAIYANIVPFIIVREVRTFRREAYKVFRRLGCASYPLCAWSKGSTVSAHETTKETKHSDQELSSDHLENVMGVRLMHQNTEEETAAHFNHLENMWEYKLLVHYIDILGIFWTIATQKHDNSSHE